MSFFTNLLAPSASSPQPKPASQPAGAAAPSATAAPAPEQKAAAKQDQGAGQQSPGDAGTPGARPQVAAATYEAIVLAQSPLPPAPAPAPTADATDAARTRAIQSLADMRVEDMISDLGKTVPSPDVLALEDDASLDETRQARESGATASAREVQAAYAETLGDSEPAQKESAYA